MPRIVPCSPFNETYQRYLVTDDNAFDTHSILFPKVYAF